MKKFYALLIGFVLLVSLSSVALGNQNGNLGLNRIVIIEDNPIVSSVVVDNDLGTEFTGGKVVVSIPELGLWASKKVHLRNGKYATDNVFLDVPEDFPTGDYYVRVVVSNKDVKRVKHRLITIE